MATAERKKAVQFDAEEEESEEKYQTAQAQNLVKNDESISEEMDDEDKVEDPPF